MYFTCITFDLEEFNLPLDFKIPIEKEKMLNISLKGFLNLINILKKYKIKCTFFTTSFFVEEFPQIIENLRETGHEIGLHAENLEYKFLKEKKEKIEEIIHEPIYGFRSHKFQLPNFRSLRKLGFKYDSSVHPTLIPGRYNYLMYPTSYFKVEDMLEIPISVSPILRLPFSWLWFRNFGLSYVKSITQITLKKNKFINLIFHPWEFTDIKKFNLPFFIKRNTGSRMIELFDKYLKWLSKNKCVTLIDFVENWGLVTNG